MTDSYLDESGIHSEAPICVIAGYFGDRGALKKLEREWMRVLRNFKFPIADFHATELIRKPQYDPMLKALARVIASQKKVHPVSFGIVVADFYSFTLKQRKWFTGATLNETTGELLTNGAPLKPYFVPFQHCVKRITAYAPEGGKVNFFFGLNKPFGETAATLIRQMKSADHPISTWDTKDRLGETVFQLLLKLPNVRPPIFWCT